MNTNLRDTPPSARLWTEMMISAMLAGFGIVMLFFSATLLQDARLLAEVPGAIWDMLCGLPLSNAMTAPLLFVLGSAAVLSALGLMIWRGLRLGVAVLVLLAAALFTAVGYALGESNRASVGATLAVMMVNPPRPMPDFTLTNHDGIATRLSDFRGKTVVMFFGYTHCPDVCPLSLSDMRKIKAALGSDASQVNFVFISVDGERDTPQVLRRYVKAFDPDFHGLTGDERTVRQIALEYGAKFQANKPTSSSTSYTVDHTAYSYVLDAQGRWRAMWGLSTSVEDAVQVVRSVIHEANH